MKKRVVLLVVLTFLICSCTQNGVKKGSITVKNKSSYDVVFVIDYELNKSKLVAGEEKKLSWVKKNC